MSRHRSTVLLALSCALTMLGATSPVVTGQVGQAVPVPLAGAQAAPRCPSSGGGTVAEAPAPKAVVKVLGHGWGHGMGMSQYGAQGAARLGCDYRTILGTYYHGSTVAKRSLDASVLLKLAASASAATLNAETGPVEWVAGPRIVVQPEGAVWSVVRRTVNGEAGVVLLNQTGVNVVFVPNAGVLSAQHSGVVVTISPMSGTRLRTRWDIARFIGSSSGIAVTDVIDNSQGESAVQKYLMGLAEVPVSWPIEALKAQVVAARTYLTSKYSSASGVYALSTTTSDQVYRGYDQEAKDAGLGGPWHRAVVATDGQVIIDSAGRMIDAMYSSSTGGYTENRQYVYGHYGISYLLAVDDSRWDNASDNPYRRWSKGFTQAQLAQRFGFESVSAWTVARRGSSARLGGVRITGVRNGKTVTVAFTGTDAKSRLGLRSPGFIFGPAGAPAPSTPTPTPTPTPKPTPTPTPIPTPTPSNTPTPLPTNALSILRKPTPITPIEP